MTTDSHTSGETDGASPSEGAAKEFDWFDRPESRRFLWRLLWGACIVTVLLEIPLILAHKRYSHFEAHGSHGESAAHAEGAAAATVAHPPTFDGWWFFYPVLGFAGCALMILAAKGLGIWLKKPETYYADDEEKTLPEDIDDALR